MMERFGRDVPPDDTVAWTGLLYSGSGERAAVYLEPDTERSVLIPWAMLRCGTDSGGNPVVPRWYYASPLHPADYWKFELTEEESRALASPF
jgi:hypothetical protein